MRAKPHSVSWCQDLDAVIVKRCTDEKMTQSEYIRKCVREETERARAKQILGLAQFLGPGQFMT